MERLISSPDTRSVFSEPSLEDQELVRLIQEPCGMNQVDYKSAEFWAYRRYMFAEARREAGVGIGPDVGGHPTRPAGRGEKK